LAEGGLVIHGYSQLRLLAKKAGPEVQKDLDARLRDLAEPIRFTAESLATREIRRIGPKWSRMRIGVTRRVVYVAPKQRGVKTRGPDPRRRPNLADLLEERAMTPALARHEENLEAGVENVLYGFALRWNRI
jgi:hypothetical protein